MTTRGNLFARSSLAQLWGRKKRPRRWTILSQILTFSCLHLRETPRLCRGMERDPASSIPRSLLTMRPRTCLAATFSDFCNATSGLHSSPSRFETEHSALPVCSCPWNFWVHPPGDCLVSAKTSKILLNVDAAIISWHSDDSRR